MLRLLIALFNLFYCVNNSPSFSFFLFLMSCVNGRNQGLHLWPCPVVYSRCTVSLHLSSPFSLPLGSHTPEGCPGYFSRFRFTLGGAGIFPTLSIDAVHDVNRRRWIQCCWADPSVTEFPSCVTQGFICLGEHSLYPCFHPALHTARFLNLLLLLHSLTCIS